MSLSDLKQYMRMVKTANLFNIANHFKVDASLAEHMLSHWIRKGCVRPCSQPDACGKSCQKCLPAMTKVYEWV